MLNPRRKISQAATGLSAARNLCFHGLLIAPFKQLPIKKIP
jgi:hypothetical protein